MIYLKDIFNGLVTNMTLTAYFQFGYWPEIANDYMSKGRSFAQGQQRYPMIMLSAGWSENRELVDYRLEFECSPSIYIVSISKKELSTSDRSERIYKEILDPIYLEFMDKIRESRQFLLDNKRIEHEKTNLYYLRTLEANQNQLNEYVDAIEIKFNNLKILRRKCNE